MVGEPLAWMPHCEDLREKEQPQARSASTEGITGAAQQEVSTRWAQDRVHSRGIRLTSKALVLHGRVHRYRMVQTRAGGVASVAEHVPSESMSCISGG